MRYALVLLFLVNIGKADITPNHMAQGGLLTGTIVKLLGGSEKSCWIGFASGAVLGALPDLAGVIGGSQGGAWGNRNWDEYGNWHRSNTVLSFIPPIRLHLWVDSAYHAPGGGWKSGMIPYVILTMIVEGVLIWLFTKWVRT